MSPPSVTYSSVVRVLFRGDYRIGVGRLRGSVFDRFLLCHGTAYDIAKRPPSKVARTGEGVAGPPRRAGLLPSSGLRRPGTAGSTTEYDRLDRKTVGHPDGQDGDAYPRDSGPT